jgi:head-tail adaptor
MVGKLSTRLFTDKVNIQRISDTSIDERGLESTDWSTISTNVKCHIQNLGSQENRAGRNTVLTNFIIQIPSDVDVKASDRLQDTVNTDVYYEIDGVRKSTTPTNRTLGLVITAHAFE